MANSIHPDQNHSSAISDKGDNFCDFLFAENFDQPANLHNLNKANTFYGTQWKVCECLDKCSIVQADLGLLC